MTELVERVAYSPAAAAAAVGKSETLIRRCVRGVSDWPPLPAHRGPDGTLLIAREDLLAWVRQLPAA